jgi:hypothetical protein
VRAGIARPYYNIGWRREQRNLSIAMNKLSSDDGCKMERWNRVLIWGAVTLIVVLPAIAQGVVRDPSHYMSFVFAVVGMFVVLWMSWLAGRCVVDVVWLGCRFAWFEKRR